MADTFSYESRATETDDVFENLLAEIGDKLRLGHPVNFEDYARQHPELADQLHRVLPAMQALAELGYAPEETARDNDQAQTENGRRFGTLGDFRIVREIGRGGMGVVYEAEQISLRRRVALKVLPFAAVLDQRQLTRFNNEALAAAQLVHPNIVPVFGVGCERGVHHYAMHFVEGQTLAEVIAELRGRAETSVADDRQDSHGNVAVPAAQQETAPQAVLSTKCSADSLEHIRAVAALGVKVAQALDFAHEHGIVHRDIKPSNLMLDRDGNPWITDFGLALIEANSSFTVTGEILGTLRYMSPEQVSGERAVIDHRTDIYSFGVTLYELLTLQPVFTAGDRPEFLRQIAVDEPRPLRQLNEAIPADLETIITKAMSKDAGERYRTAEELADDLRRFLNDQPIRAQRPTLFQRVTKWGRRHRRFVTLVGILLVCLTIGLAVSTYRIGREQARTAEALGQALDSYEQAEAARGALMQAHRQITHERNEAVQLRDQTRRQLYVAQINLAQQAWERGNVSRVRQLLEGQQPDQTGGIDLRGWEWHYQQRLCQSEFQSLPVHAARVAISPTGRLLATAASDDRVTVWDIARGESLLELPAAYSGYSIAFGPDGRLLASGGRDSRIQIWDMLNGQRAQTFAEGYGVGLVVAFSPDGDLLAAGNAVGTVSLIDSSSGRRLQSFEVPSTVYSIAFSPDGRRLAVGAGNRKQGAPGTITLWNRVDGKQRQQRNAHAQRVESVAFSPDGRRLASGSRDGTIKLWDAVHGRLIWEKTSHPGGVSSVVFDPTGLRLVSGGAGGTLSFWDPANGQLLETLKGHIGFVHGLAFSRGGRLLVSNGDESVKLWDAASRQLPRDLRSRHEAVLRVAFGPHGRQFASGGGQGEVVVWDINDGRPRRTLDGHVDRIVSIAFCPDGDMLATADRTAVKLWNCRTGRELRMFSARGDIGCMALSPIGRILAVGDSEGTLTLRDWESGLVTHSFDGHAASVVSVAFHPDGRRLATCDANHQIKIWATDNPKSEEFHIDAGAPVRELAFSPDGRRLASGGDDGLRIWNAETGRLLQQPQTGKVHSVQFSPDSKRLVSSGADGAVKLWDVTSGQEVRTLSAHADNVCDVTFSPDGSILASCSKDATIKFWDSRPLTPKLRTDLLAIDLLQSQSGTFSSATEFAEPIRTKPWLPDEVRKRALELAPLYWQRSVKQQAETLLHSRRAEASSRQEIIKRLQNDSHTSEPVRRRAIKLIGEQPDDESSLIDRAAHLARGGHIALAAELIEQSRRLSQPEPGGIEERRILAHRYYRLGHYLSKLSPPTSHALESLNRAVVLEAGLPDDTPRSAIYRLELASLYVRFAANTETVDEAESCYRREIEIREQLAAEFGRNAFFAQLKLPLALSRLGSILSSTGRYAEAEELFRKAIELNPKAGVQGKLAWLKANCPEKRLRDPQRAVELATAAVEAEPNSARRALVLGAAYYRIGQYSAAIESLTRPDAEHSTVAIDAKSDFFLAMSHWKLREQEEALRYFRAAIELTREHQLNHDEFHTLHTEAARLLRMPEPARSSDPAPTESTE